MRRHRKLRSNPTTLGDNFIAISKEDNMIAGDRTRPIHVILFAN